MTVAELGARMGAKEFDEWAEYYSVEPWGAYRDNLHAGIIAATFANAHKKKTAKASKPADFLLRTQTEARAGETAKTLNGLRALGRKNGNGSR